MEDFRADFQVTLDNALTEVAKLRDEAKKVLDRYNAFADPEYDAAFQVWQDLDRSHGELTRTKAMIDNGYI